MRLKCGWPLISQYSSAITSGILGTCCGGSAAGADPEAAWAGSPAAGIVSGTGVAVEGGRTGSGGAAEELDAVDIPQGSAVHHLPE